MSHTVLLVEENPETREVTAGWLSDAGFDVLTCPGPSAPDYTCIASRGTPCPLSDAASIVVLDLSLASDQIMQGTPAWEILLYYRSEGKGVAVLAGDEDPMVPLAERMLAVLPRSSDRDAVVSAVRALAAALEESPDGLGNEVPDS